MSDNSEDKLSFEELAEEENNSFCAELWSFLKHNKKWWFLPILIVLGLLTGLASLGSSAAAPWIYSLF